LPGRQGTKSISRGKPICLPRYLGESTQRRVISRAVIIIIIVYYCYRYVSCAGFGSGRVGRSCKITGDVRDGIYILRGPWDAINSLRFSWSVTSCGGVVSGKGSTGAALAGVTETNSLPSVFVFLFVSYGQTRELNARGRGTSFYSINDVTTKKID